MTTPIRFIHCADLHLGSRFVGISSEDPELGKKLINSTFKALDVIVEKSKSSAVDFVIFSGDIFDDGNESPYTRNYFVEAIREIGVPCYIAYGNHDYKRKWEDAMPLPENAFVFGKEITRYTFPPVDPTVEILGISYATKSETRNLTQMFEGSSDLYSIGVLHCDVDIPNSTYAPCSYSDFIGKNVDYWALGHIHKSAILSTDPYVVYPGNTQGRDVGELGEKGAFLVTVIDGKVAKTDFFRTSSILWEDIEITIDNNTELKTIINGLKQGCEKGSVIRITIKGFGSLDSMLRLETEEIRKFIESETECICSNLIVRTSPEINLTDRQDTGDFISAVIEYGRSLSILSKNELIDLICNTKSSSNVRGIYEEMTADELRAIIDDAVKHIIEKLWEAER